MLDYRIPEGLDTFARSGRIGIQVHGGRDDPEDAAVRFKNLRVRELPAGAHRPFTRADDGTLSLTAVGEAAGWESLFNGEDLTGWAPAGKAEEDMDDAAWLLVGPEGGFTEAEREAAAAAGAATARIGSPALRVETAAVAAAAILLA